MRQTTIILPAHNEAAVIQGTLRGLLDGLDEADSSNVQVLVVCNGCTDDTAGCARAVGDPRVRVIELAVGSKPGALNEGDRAAEAFPQIYMDADVRMSGSDLLRLVAFMEYTGVPAAVPKAKMDFTGVGWPVRAYYRVWFSLPYVKSGMVGCGVYALSEKGRQRFDEFPDIISDDGFVRAHFADEERPVVPGCEVVVRAPKTLAGLIRIKTRSRLGGRQLRRQYPELFAKELKNPRMRSILRLLARPSLWLSVPCYCFVVAVSLWRSKCQLQRNQFHHWERDETSRQSVANT